MQLYYHNCHNLCYGTAFFADHKAFEKFYKECEDDYDAAAERAIGLYNEQLDLEVLLPAIAMNLKSLTRQYSNNTDMMYNDGMTLEKELQKICDTMDMNPKATSGIKQLVGTIGEHSEIRAYKLKQRMQMQEKPEQLPMDEKIQEALKAQVPNAQPMGQSVPSPVKAKVTILK